MGSRLLEETDQTPSPVIERLEARIADLEAQLATARADGEAEFRAGYSAGLDACGESTNMLDEDAAFQVYKRAKTNQSEANNDGT